MFRFARSRPLQPHIPCRVAPSQRTWRELVTYARSVLSRLDDRDATLVEFAVVAPPLFLLLLTVLDLGIMLTTQSLLDGAARNAARLVRTGQVQSATSPETTFQNQLCSDMTPIMSTATCQSNIIFEVQTFTDFSSVSFGACTQDSDSTQSGYCTFTPGIASQIVGVQVTYSRPFLVPWVGACLSGGSCWFGAGTTDGTNAGTGTGPLVSTVIFRNEPFPSSS